MNIILECTRKLFRKSGRINAYVCFCFDKKPPDIDRLKNEIADIKKIISDLEMKIANFKS